MAFPYENNKSELDINRWPIFSLLDEDFKRKIKMVCVFGSSGSEALMITADDEVYALGSNNCGCLGIGELVATLKPIKIEALSGRKLRQFAYGTGPHCVAVTEDGDIWVWGNNCYCQLGNASSNQQNTPLLLGPNVVSRGVKTVACGGHHTMVLTFDGEVYTWGQNNCGQIGSGSTSNQTTPRKVNSASSYGQKTVTEIACGQAFSMVVLETGEVYGWGYNSNSQLGNLNNTNQTLPNRVQGFEDIHIVKIACGISHNVAISSEGKLYSWGSNSYGQLGKGDKDIRMTPVKVKCEEGRFVDIGAIHYNHMSTAMTLPGHVFMWGQCRGQVVTTPLKTPFKTLQEAFACYGSAPITHKPLRIVQSPKVTLTEDIGKSFDDPSTSDLRIIVEGKEIHAHRSILSIRCDYFRNMFQSEWLESSKSDIEVQEFTYEVYRAFLRYLYTDELQLEPEEAVGLLDLANCYCQCQLKDACQMIIRDEVSINNVMMIYAAAIKFNAKDLEDYCFRFSINHLTAVVQTEAFEQLDGEIVKDFFKKAAKHGSFRH